MILKSVESKNVLSEDDRVKAKKILEDSGCWWEGNNIFAVEIDDHTINPRRVTIRFKDKNNKSYSRFITYKFWINPVEEKKEEFVMPKSSRRR